MITRKKSLIVRMKESAQAQKALGIILPVLLALLIFILTGNTCNFADGCIYPSASDTNRGHHS